MRAVLVAAAAPFAAIAFTTPAQAQFAGGPTIQSGQSHVREVGRFEACGFRDDRGFRVRHDRDRDRDGGRRHRGGGVLCDISVGTFYEGGEWALYNNRSWESNSYNDWWHDQPWRSYPRWMQNNRNCDRMWWGGGVWRCGW